MNAYTTRAVADAIASHLAAYPDSADTVEGIHQWWLRPLGLDHSIEVTARALELLAMERVVECRSVGQRNVWRRRRITD